MEEQMFEEQDEQTSEPISEEVDFSNETEEQSPVIKKGKSKVKKVIISVLLILIICLLAIVGYSYWSYNSQIKHISKNALAIAKLDFPSFAKKSGMLKKGEVSEDMLGILEEYNLDALVKDPRSTGLVTAKPSFLFFEYDDKEDIPYVFMVMPIANEEKVSKFMQNIVLPRNKEFPIQKKSNIYKMEFNGVSAMWQGKTMIIGITDPDKDDNLSKKVKSFLIQEKSSSIATNKSFHHQLFKQHDVSLWVNLDNMARTTVKGFKEAEPVVQKLISQREEYERMNDYLYYMNYNYYWNYLSNYDYSYPSNLFEKILFEAVYNNEIPLEIIKDIPTNFYNTYLTLYADFQKGMLKSDVKIEMSSDRRKKLKTIIKNSPNIKNIYPYVPIDGLVLTGSVQTNYPQAWNLFEKRIKKFAKDNADSDLNMYLKHCNKLLDGSAVYSVNILNEGEPPFITLIASVKNNRGIEEILKELERNGEVYKVGKYYHIDGNATIFFEDYMLIATTNYNNYKKSERGLKGNLASMINKKPLSMTLDFAAMNNLLSDLSHPVEDALDLLSNLDVKAVTNGGTPDELTLQLSFNDKKTNSLKQIKDYVTNYNDFWKDFSEYLMYTVSGLIEETRDNNEYSEHQDFEDNTEEYNYVDTLY